jgi:hypothetical protein
MANRSLVSVLARAFLAGEPGLDQMVTRSHHALGRSWDWIPPLAQRYLESVDGGTRQRHRDVIAFISQDAGYRRAVRKHFDALSVQHWLTAPAQMRPVQAARSWGLPVIESVAALADWLWLEFGDLEWFADLKLLGLKQIASRLRHYHYRVFSTSSGSIRLIESPKRRLRKLQREILSGILECIPPHPAAHGFVKGRSIRTFAAPHAGQRVVLRMDLRNFFASIGLARIQAAFRTLGYPEPIAELLSGICTNATPRDTWNYLDAELDAATLHDARDLYARRHLPQGAPSSPALANICAFRLDCRLMGLAKAAGAEYTRYADDLAFSGGSDFERRVKRFSTHVAAILLEEGFSAHHRKTRIMRSGVRQHLAGIVINERLNVFRADFDLLKAVLTNCARLGPESQNRAGHPAFRSHLEGRVAFIEMVNSVKGERLRAILRSDQVVIERLPTSPHCLQSRLCKIARSTSGSASGF